jgi:hypothetical protein
VLAEVNGESPETMLSQFVLVDQHVTGTAG